MTKADFLTLTGGAYENEYTQLNRIHMVLTANDSEFRTMLQNDVTRQAFLDLYEAIALYEQRLVELKEQLAKEREDKALMHKLMPTILSAFDCGDQQTLEQALQQVVGRDSLILAKFDTDIALNGSDVQYLKTILNK